MSRVPLIPPAGRAVPRAGGPPTAASLCVQLVLLLLLVGLVGAQPALAGVDRWTAAGPPGGQVRTLLADPSAVGHLYAIHSQGLYKTLDGARSWLPLGSGLPTGFVLHVALDPLHPATVYAEIADETALEPRSGLYRSLDAGATWRHRGDRTPWSVLVVVPGEPDTLLAVGAGDPELTTLALFRSEDAGATWERLLDLPDVLAFHGLVAGPGPGGAVYLLEQDRLRASFDQWDTWADIGPTSGPDGEPPSNLLSLAVAPGDPEVLYLFGFADGYRSEDGGASWLALGAPPCASRTRVDPRDPYTVYIVCFDRVVRSHDGGATWETVPVEPAGAQPIFRDLAIDPMAPDHLYVGGDVHGVFASPDGGATWQRASAGLRGMPVDSIAFDPRAPGTWYAITPGIFQDPGDGSGTVSSVSWLWRTGDAGATWSRWLIGFEASVYQVVPVPPGLGPATGQVDLATSDGLFVWDEASGTLRQVSSQPLDGLALDAADPDLLYAITGRGVSWSGDGGSTWHEGLVLPAGSSWEGYRVGKLLADPALPGRVYALVEEWVIGAESGFYLEHSTDGGRTWSRLPEWPDSDSDLHFGAPAAPGAPSTLYADSEVSRDGGATWQPTGFPGSVVLALPRSGVPTTLYAQGEGGLFRSGDGGATWMHLELAGERGAGWGEILAADPQAPERLLQIGSQGTLPLRVALAVGSRPLALQGGRFEVRAAWRDAEGRYGPARPLALSGSAGVFTLPGRERVAAAVDLLDRRAEDGRFHLLGAGLLPVETTVTVTDSASGRSRDLVFPGDRAVSLALPDTFPALPEPPGWGPTGLAARYRWTDGGGPDGAGPMRGGTELAGGGRVPTGQAVTTPCEPGATSLCLLDGRFRVEGVRLVGESGPRQAPLAWPASVEPLIWQSGTAWLDGPEAPSALIQMVDGKAINGFVWVLIGGLSEAPYAVRVTDTLSGRSRLYLHAAGEPASVADLAAF